MSTRHGRTHHRADQEHEHRWVDFGQGPLCVTCRARLVVANPSAIGNRDETPIVAVLAEPEEQSE